MANFIFMLLFVLAAWLLVGIIIYQKDEMAALEYACGVSDF